MKYLLSFICFLIYFSASSQTTVDSVKKRNFFVEFGTGVSVPVGNFAKTDSDNSKSGFAKNGLSFYANYNRVGKKNFGLKLALSLNAFRPDKNIDTTMFVIPPSSNIKHTVTYGNWFLINFLMGPTYDISKKNITVNFSLLAGVLLSNRPSINHYFYTDKIADGSQYLIRNGKGTSFSIRPEVSVKYSFSKRFALKFYCALTYSSAKYSYDIICNNKNFNPLIAQYDLLNEVDVVHSISYLDMGICISLEQLFFIVD
jgi:hypothetical protein